MRKNWLSILSIFCFILVAAIALNVKGDETRNHFLHQLGGPFFISRSIVHDDLKLSDDQKQKLEDFMTPYVQEAMDLEKLPKEQRPKGMKQLRERSYEALETHLKGTLDLKQQARFEQLKLQYNVPSIFVEPEIEKKLGVSDEQRMQFIAAIQEMQKQVMPLMKQAQSTGNPKEILPKVIKLRRDCEAKIVSLMTDAQQQQWREMTGIRLDIW